MFSPPPNQSTTYFNRPDYSKPLPRPARPPSKREHRNARVYEPNLKFDFPDRPQTARLPAERPAPIVPLPGLPSRPFTPSAREQRRLYGSPKWFDGAGTYVAVSFKSLLADRMNFLFQRLLAKFRAPWTSDPAVPKSAPARPATPTTARTPKTPRTPYSPRFPWQSETRSPRHKDNRTLADFDDTLPEDFVFSPGVPTDDMYKPEDDEYPFDDEFDPPPLNKRLAPEGGMSAWRTVFGAYVDFFEVPLTSPDI